MRDNRIFTAAAILLLAIWAGYNLYMSYTSPSYCPMGNHSIYSYSNLLPVLLIVILALSLLPKSKLQSRTVRDINNKSKKSENTEGIGKSKEPSGALSAIQKKDVKGLDVRKNAQSTNILSVIRESPGITQEELREITGYSASKISVEVKELEEKGLIRREKHGRTYRIHPE